MQDKNEDEEKIEKGAVYENMYTMREIGGGISVSVPKKVVERKANELDLSIKKFTEKYRVKAMYDNFKNIDVGYKFVKKDVEEE